MANTATVHRPFNSLAHLIADAFRPAQPAANSVTATPRRSLADRLDAWFWRQRQREMEAWLAESGDIFELERRVRDIGHGAGMRGY